MPAINVDSSVLAGTPYEGMLEGRAPEPVKTAILPEADEQAYRAWLEGIGMTHARGYAVDENYNGTDYDLRAYYRKYGPTDVAAGEHFTDEFKLPNHATFSDESIYATGPNARYAGHWKGDTFVPPAEPAHPDFDMRDMAALEGTPYADLIAKPTTREETSKLGDVGRGVMAAFAETGAAAGFVGEMAGVPGGAAARHAGEDAAATWVRRMSPEYRASRAKPITSVEGATDPMKWASLLAENLPFMFTGVGLGAGITRGIVKKTISAELRAQARAGSEAALKEIAKRSGRAGIVGAAIGEAGVAGPLNGKQAFDQVMDVDEATIVQSPAYQEMYWSLPDDMPDKERRRQAREAIAKTAAKIVGAVTMGTTAVLGAPSGKYLGELIGGAETGPLFSRIAKGFLLEGPGQEAPQTVAEDLTANLVIGELADPARQPTQGMIEDVIASTLAGGVAGGAFAMAGGEAGPGGPAAPPFRPQPGMPGAPPPAPPIEGEETPEAALQREIEETIRQFEPATAQPGAAVAGQIRDVQAGQAAEAAAAQAEAAAASPAGAEQALAPAEEIAAPEPAAAAPEPVRAPEYVAGTPVSDERLKEQPRRQGLAEAGAGLVEGGGTKHVDRQEIMDVLDSHGIAYSPDAITGFTTPSLNPQWARDLIKTGLTVGQIRSAFDKALSGKKLGPRQTKIVQGTLTALEELPASNRTISSYSSNVPTAQQGELDPFSDENMLRQPEQHLEAARAAAEAGDDAGAGRAIAAMLVGGPGSGANLLPISNNKGQKPKGSTTPNPREDNLIRFLAKSGGLDRADMEAADEFIHVGHGVGFPLIRKAGTGMSMDHAAEIAAEAGYPVFDEDGNYSPHVLREMLHRDNAHQDVFSLNSGKYEQSDAIEREREVAARDERNRARAAGEEVPEEEQPVSEEIAPEDMAIVARANELDAEAVERAAMQHESPADFMRAINAIVAAEQPTEETEESDYEYGLKLYRKFLRPTLSPMFQELIDAVAEKATGADADALDAILEDLAGAGTGQSGDFDKGDPYGSQTRTKALTDLRALARRVGVAQKMLDEIAQDEAEEAADEAYENASNDEILSGVEADLADGHRDARLIQWAPEKEGDSVAAIAAFDEVLKAHGWRQEGRDWVNDDGMLFVRSQGKGSPPIVQWSLKGEDIDVASSITPETASSLGDLFGAATTKEAIAARQAEIDKKLGKGRGEVAPQGKESRETTTNETADLFGQAERDAYEQQQQDLFTTPKSASADGTQTGYQTAPAPPPRTFAEIVDESIGRQAIRATAQRVRAVQTVVDRLKATLGGLSNVIVVGKLSDIDNEAVRKKVIDDSKKGRVHGVASRSTGNLYLIAANLDSGEMVIRTLLHEGTHLGLVPLFGQDAVKVLGDVWKWYAGRPQLVRDTKKGLQREGIAAEAERIIRIYVQPTSDPEYNKALQDILLTNKVSAQQAQQLRKFGPGIVGEIERHQILVADELLAAIGEKALKAPWWRRLSEMIKTKIAQMFRAIGIDRPPSYSDEDIIALVARSQGAAFKTAGGLNKPREFERDELADILFSIGRTPRQIFGVSNNKVKGAAFARPDGSWEVFLADGSSLVEPTSNGKHTKQSVKTQAQAEKLLRSRGLEIGYRQADPTRHETDPIPANIGQLPEESWLQHVLRLTADRMNRLKVIMAEVSKRGGRYDTEADAYLKEELMHRKIPNELRKLYETHVKPLVEAVGKSPASWEDVERYLYARGAPERNERMRRINKVRAANEPDFSGSGMPNEEATQILDEFRAKGWTNLRVVDGKVVEEGEAGALDGIGERFSAMNSARLQLALDRGLITEEAFRKMGDAYRYYFPARGVAPELEEAAGTGERTGKGYSTRHRERFAFGRASKASFIVETSISMFEHTIVHAEHNEVAKALARYVQMNADDELWKINPIDYKPRFNKDTGEVEYRAGRRREDEEIDVMIDGKAQRIWIKDPLLRRAFLLSTRNQFAGLMNVVSTYTRWLAMLNTALDPEFMIVNGAKDLQTAMLNLQDSRIAEQFGGRQLDAPAIASAALKDLRKALVGSWKALRNDPTAADDEWVKWFREFREAGGKIAYMGYTDVENKRRDLMSLIRRSRGGARAEVEKVGLAVGQFLMTMNDTVESGIRVATYANLRRQGVAADVSASIAGNLTVNFTKRGEWGPILNGLYMFYNASIQAQIRMLSAVLRSKRLQKIMGAVAVSGLMFAELARWMGGDDDDGIPYYEKIGEWDRINNLVVIMPWMDKGQYVKLPLPYGYSSFYALGVTLSRVLHGEVSPAMGAVQFAGSVVNAWNPLGNNQNIVEMVSPTVLDPVVQIYMNRNFFGGPIAKEKPTYAQYDMPRSQMYWSTVSPMSKAFATALNRWTGGSEFRPGIVDVNPEHIDHILEQYTGGAGRTLKRAINLLYATAGGELDELPLKEVPGVRRLVGQAPEFFTATRYSKNVSDIITAKKEQANLDATDTRQKASAHRKKYAVSLRLQDELKAAEHDLRDLYEARGALARSRLEPDQLTRRLEQLDDQIEKRQRRFNASVERAKARATQ